MTRLTFPGDPLPIRGEMFIDGTWTDVTDSIRLENEITISGRGRANEQGRPSPCTCDFYLNDRVGLFNNRLPTSTYYGKLPPNLPFRASVTEDRSFAILDTVGASRVKTTDKAVLDITGDIDIRVEYELNNPPDGLNGYYLASKARSGGNISWSFLINKLGYLEMLWSTDGTTQLTVLSTTIVSPMYGPIAARVTVDVNNGAAGADFKFYTSDTIAGSWTQLGATVTHAGTTSFFSGTAEVELGRVNDGAGPGATHLPLDGRIYAFELYSGIAGTKVADAAIYNQARGTTSWSDGLGTPNTWTVEGSAEITPDDRRFTGELSSLPPQWDTSGNDVYIKAQAADVTRRLSKGATVVDSPLATLFSALAATGYWKCEDGSQSTSLANSVAGGIRAVFTDISFGKPSDLPATAGAITMNSVDSMVTFTPKTVANTGFACFDWAMKMQAVPSGSTTVFNLYCTGGTIGIVAFVVTSTTYAISVYGTDNVLITSNSTLWTTNTVPSNWNLFRIQLTQSGGNVQLDLGWYHPGENVLTGAAALIFAGTAGRFSRGDLVGRTDTIGAQFCHLFFGQFFLDNTAGGYVEAASAFAGETTVERFARVATANGIGYQIIGSTADAEPMGAQSIDTPLNILFDCNDTERGQIYPDRNSLDLLFRTRRSLLNQFGPQIDYSLEELGPLVPEPIPDDALLRNTVTATRPQDSSTGFAQITDGVKGTDSAGVVPGSINTSPFLSSRLDDMAAFDAFLGTWDEDRWTNIQVELVRQNYVLTATKIRKAHILAHLDIGDLFSIINPPVWLPPDEIKLMIQGVDEVLGNRTWRFVWNTSPYGPFIVNDLTQSIASAYRVAATTSTVTGSLTSTATGAAAFTITTPAGSKLWGTTATKPGNFPLDVAIGGEVITLSAITGTTSPQTADISARSVNGVVKAHSAGDSIQVANPFYMTL